MRLDESGRVRTLRDAMEKQRKNIAEVLDEVISLVDNKTGDK